MVLLRGTELRHTDHILNCFPATTIGDTSEALTWAEAVLALRDRRVKAACRLKQWLVILDPEARLPGERAVLEQLARTYATTVIGLISNRDMDLHLLAYHSKERQRSFLWRGGRSTEETGTPLFQETELAPIAWDYGNMIKLLTRLAISPRLLADAGPFILKALHVERRDGRDWSAMEPEFSLDDMPEENSGEPV